MKDTKCSLINSCSLDRTFPNTPRDCATASQTKRDKQPSDRPQLDRDLKKYTYPFTYFSQGDHLAWTESNRQDKQLVSTIQRGNRLKTPKLYAELAISFMCKNYNIKSKQP
jgi:hypothetical protein